MSVVKEGIALTIIYPQDAYNLSVYKRHEAASLKEADVVITFLITLAVCQTF